MALRPSHVRQNVGRKRSNPRSGETWLRRKSRILGRMCWRITHESLESNGILAREYFAMNYARTRPLPDRDRNRR